MKKRNYLYKAFGITISSEIQIKELKNVNQEKAEAKIEYGEIENPIPQSEKYTSKTEICEGGFLCYINGIGGVKICNEKKIIVSPEDGMEERGFRFLVSGIALGLLLHLRGFVTLHASAVAVQDRVIAFIGQKGMGKSTTAAALHGCGHPIVTDDLLVLDTTGDSVQAYPGFPHLKLMPESIAKSVNKSPERIPKIDPKNPKRSFAAESNFREDPLPLECIYVLEYRKEERNNEPILPYSETIRGRKAFIELIRNSYVARLLPEETVSEQHMKHSAEIAQAVSVRRLYRKYSLDDLPTLVSFIEQDQISDEQSGG